MRDTWSWAARSARNVQTHRAIDELTRGVVLALFSVLTGGVLVVLGQAVADRRLDQRLKRAILVEIRANATTIETLAAGMLEVEPLPRLRREAWTAAHGLRWGEKKLRALMGFYHWVDEYERLAMNVVTRELEMGRIPPMREKLAAIGRAALDAVEGAKRAAS